MNWRQTASLACALGFLFAFGCTAALGETVLLDFQTDWCGYCRMMEPVVDQLAAEGYKVRRINGDQEPDLVRQFRIEGYPTFVVLREDREIGRVSGKTTAGELKSLLGKARTGEAKSGGWRGATVRGQSPDPAMATIAPPARPVGDWEPARESTNVVPPPTVAAAAPRPLIAASVRLRIQDGHGQSVGSGTIIDSRDGEALVLTCGHMFREWKESGQILVDLFGPGAATQIPATLVSYDLNSDVGLVRIKGDYRLAAARVAAAGYNYRKGETVVSVGCDNGADATERPTQIVSVNRYSHAPNVQVAFEPVQGRSGGGLFNAQGEIIGVCNAADADEKQGLFAALAAIHAELDRVKLAFVYNNEAAGKPQAGHWPVLPVARAEAFPREPDGQSNDRQWTAIATESPSARELTSDERALLDELRSAHGTEVICLVRSLDDPQAKSRVFQINRASAAFWRELAEGGSALNGPRLTSLDRTRVAQAKTHPLDHSSASDLMPRTPAISAMDSWPARSGSR